jgi:hypothetical protein
VFKISFWPIIEFLKFISLDFLKEKKKGKLAIAVNVIYRGFILIRGGLQCFWSNRILLVHGEVISWIIDNYCSQDIYLPKLMKS